MSTPERIESLKSKHARLDAELHSEKMRPMPDESVLQTIKIQKLQIKDQLRSMGVT